MAHHLSFPLKLRLTSRFPCLSILMEFNSPANLLNSESPSSVCSSVGSTPDLTHLYISATALVPVACATHNWDTSTPTSDTWMAAISISSSWVGPPSRCSICLHCLQSTHLRLSPSAFPCLSPCLCSMWYLNSDKISSHLATWWEGSFLRQSHISEAWSVRSLNCLPYK